MKRIVILALAIGLSVTAAAARPKLAPVRERPTFSHFTIIDLLIKKYELQSRSAFVPRQERHDPQETLRAPGIDRHSTAGGASTDFQK